ncbi:MAG: glycosyltransferase family 4 protein [Anaerolineae bacterium]|nr:glycosyltransferase family 4 protein [Anaerolineae bacterium]
MAMRVLYFSEALVPPFDEGIKKASWHLLRALQSSHEVLALTNRGSGIPDGGVHRVRANRLLLSAGLVRRVRAFAPERTFYFPTACATLFSFVRARVLATYARTPVAMVAFQPREYGRLARVLIPLLRAGPVWAQGEATATPLRDLGCDVRILPPAVDTEAFAPADETQRRVLRAQYGLAPDVPLVLHAGHILPNRNMQALVSLQQALQGEAQVMVVGSSAFGVDEALARALKDAGAIVITHYVERLVELYQMADCYVFPVHSVRGSVEIPLSVLEAMACNLPVVSTPFGELPRLFPPGDGVRYVAADADLADAVRQALAEKPVRTRSRVEGYSWAAAARMLIAGKPA